MTVEQIESQWLRVDTGTVKSGFHSIRISAECIPELFLGIDTGGLRNLILAIPRYHDFRFKGVDKQNLSIEFYKESNHVIVKLVNPSFADLFNDLILSLYNKVCFMNDVESYGKEFIQAFYRWSGFFTDISGSGPSDDAVKGIFGELLLLKDLVEASDALGINETLYAWKGPYDAVNDFEFDRSLIEVKTKDDSKINIRISSEFQLVGKPDKQLSLCIISVTADPVNGLSVNEIVLSIKDMVWQRLGDNAIFINALAKKGLFNQNLSQYDHIRFRPVAMAFYDCDAELFPKITPAILKESITEVTYSLRVSELEEFKQSEKML